MHPTIKIAYLMMLAVMINFMHSQMLLWLALVMFIAHIHYKAYSTLNMIARTRWLFFSLILVYSFNTPGEYMHHWPTEFAPTYEGVVQGGLQILRITLMITGFALLTKTTSKQALMAGFYQLLIPVKWFSLYPERFAARLWLTLRYVEHEHKYLAKQTLIKRLESNYLGEFDESQSLELIEILVPKMRALDICMLALLIPLSYFIL